jgi:hypothetical protein
MDPSPFGTRAPVTVREVGPPDGLQILARTTPTADKPQWIQGAHEAGLRELEVGSFMPPKLMPQVADSVEKLEYRVATRAIRAYERSASRSVSRGTSRDANLAHEPLRSPESHRCDVRHLRSAIGHSLATSLDRVFQQNRPAPAARHRQLPGISPGDLRLAGESA